MRGLKAIETAVRPLASVLQIRYQETRMDRLLLPQDIARHIDPEWQQFPPQADFGPSLLATSFGRGAGTTGLPGRPTRSLGKAVARRGSGRCDRQEFAGVAFTSSAVRAPPIFRGAHMRFVDFEIRAWQADSEHVQVLVHRSPAGSIRRPIIVPFRLADFRGPTAHFGSVW
jgi:hypothetical protein